MALQHLVAPTPRDLHEASSAQRRADSFSRLFAHEVIKPSNPVSGFLCVRQDYTHPAYPGLRWVPGSEHLGHFCVSVSPLGSMSWLDPAERLFLRIIEVSLVPDAIVGGGHDTVEAQRVVVSAERSKPLGPHTEALQEFWSSVRPDKSIPRQQTVVDLASEALLRFRLYGRFSCRGISLVKPTVNRSGWTSNKSTDRSDRWVEVWTVAMDELKRLRLRAMNDSEWALALSGLGEFVNKRLSGLPRVDLLGRHIQATSYAVAAGPVSARLNPFVPLVRLGLMGLPAFGMIGDWFWVGTNEHLTPGRYPLRDSFGEIEDRSVASVGP